VRREFLPFHRPWIDDASVKEVVEALQSGWITRGPRTAAFEEGFRQYVGARHAIALNSCTAGLHLALVAAGVGPESEVITSPITFPATANVVVHQGARPVFVDVEPGTLNLDAAKIEACITPRTRAIIPVHFAGQACDMAAILDVAKRRGLVVINDAAHAIETSVGDRKVGTLGDFTAYSFYATKNLTTGEGGMLTAEDDALAERARILSLHGISHDAWRRYDRDGPAHWETLAPGYKYNMSDIQAALGLRQLERLDEWWETRRQYVELYRSAFRDCPHLALLSDEPGRRSAYHLLVILLQTETLAADRDTIVAALKAENIGTGIHFRALHLHPYYREAFLLAPGSCPVAERASDRLLSLPLYPRMSRGDLEDVVAAVWKVLAGYAR
jgi:dTDP-4-amino-4,6-dideoxygalactose transaminase